MSVLPRSTQELQGQLGWYWAFSTLHNQVSEPAPRQDFSEGLVPRQATPETKSHGDRANKCNIAFSNDLAGNCQSSELASVSRPNWAAWNLEVGLDGTGDTSTCSSRQRCWRTNNRPQEGWVVEAKKWPFAVGFMLVKWIMIFKPKDDDITGVSLFRVEVTLHYWQRRQNKVFNNMHMAWIA